METNTPSAAEPAGPWLRFLAERTDWMVASCLQLAPIVALALAHAGGAAISVPVLAAAAALMVGLTLAYFAFFTWAGRETPGHRLAGLRTQTLDGRPLSAGPCLRRAVVKTLSYAVYALGSIASFVAILAAPSRRALHDLAAGTRVVCEGQPRKALLPLALVSVAAPFVLVFGLLRPYVAQVYYMPASSMAPTLQVDDRFIVNKLYYRLREPARGDLVVFSAPPQADPQQKDFVKRVIGVGGDTVEVRDGKLLVNGDLLIEPYIAQPPVYEMPPVEVQPGRLFVLGDNRNNSLDSHVWGWRPSDQLEVTRLKGKAMVIFSPFRRMGALETSAPTVAGHLAAAPPSEPGADPLTLEDARSVPSRREPLIETATERWFYVPAWSDLHALKRRPTRDRSSPAFPDRAEIAYRPFGPIVVCGKPGPWRAAGLSSFATAVYPVQADPYDPDLVWFGCNDGSPNLHVDRVALAPRTAPDAPLTAGGKVGGLGLLDVKRRTIRYFGPGAHLVGARVYKLAFEKDAVWIWGRYPAGGERDGLSRYDRATGKVEPFPLPQKGALAGWRDVEFHFHPESVFVTAPGDHVSCRPYRFDRRKKGWSPMPYVWGASTEPPGAPHAGHAVGVLEEKDGRYRVVDCLAATRWVPKASVTPDKR